MSGDMPCFSVESNFDTKKGIPLYDLNVRTDRPAGSDEDLVRWSMAIEPPGKSVQISPERCIRYGTVPESGVQTVLKTLEPYAVYFVAIGARPDDSSITAYVALFCLKPAETGKLTVQHVSRDNSLGEGRYEVCKKPPA